MFFEVMLFIFNLIAQFIGMLFTVWLTPTISLGQFMGIVYITLPIIISVICLLKNQEISNFVFDLREQMHARDNYKGKHSKGYHVINGYNPKHASGYKVRSDREDDN